MPNVLPNTGAITWDDTKDSKKNFQEWYNLVTGVQDSNLIKVDTAIGENKEKIRLVENKVPSLASKFEVVEQFTQLIPKETIDNATYKQAYVGTVNNVDTMPNTGQFRIQYFPYWANNEGYSVQVAWGCVTNAGGWYRKSQGTVWQPWVKIVDTDTLNEKGMWSLPKEVSSGSCNALTETGVYLVSSYTMDDCPTPKGTDCAFVLDVKKGTATSFSQMATSYYGVNSIGRMFLRTCLNGKWGSWIQVSNKAQLLRDVNIDNFYEEGTTRLFNAIGTLPQGITPGSNDIFVTVYPLEESTNFVRRVILDNRTNKMFLYSKQYGWAKVSTTEYTDIVLLNGWTNKFPDQYTLRATRTGNLVNIIGSITGGTATINTVIGNLPLSYRPKKVVLGYAHIIGGTRNDDRFLILPDGNMTINSQWDSSLSYQIDFTFPIE